MDEITSNQQDSTIQHSTELAPTGKTEPNPSKRAVDGTFRGRRVGSLGKRTQVFMELVIAGKATWEAYTLAGYKGTKQSAYVLRSKLKHYITERLLSEGVSREGIGVELLKLNSLPVNAQTVTVKEKILILKMIDKITEKDVDRPQITPFLVNIDSPKSVTIQETK